MKKGDKVKYRSYPGALIERGIVKGLCDNPDYVFVVFNCGGEWKDYENYTGAATRISQLTLIEKPDLSDANGRQYDTNVDEYAAWKEYKDDMEFFGKI